MDGSRILLIGQNPAYAWADEDTFLAAGRPFKFLKDAAQFPHFNRIRLQTF